MEIIQSFVSIYLIAGILGSVAIAALVVRAIAKFTQRIPAMVAVIIGGIVSPPIAVGAFSAMWLGASDGAFFQHYLWLLGQQVEYFVFLIVALFAGHLVANRTFTSRRVSADTEEIFE